jgi:arachidonate 15-lipoxygenase
MPAPTLPHDDPFPTIRSELLAHRREERRYDYSSPVGVACLEELQLPDKPGPDYLLAIARSNAAVSDHHVGQRVVGFRDAKTVAPVQVGLYAAMSAVEAARSFWDATTAAAAATAPKTATSLDDYADFTDGLEPIPLVQRLRAEPASRDALFGWQRLGGPNPFALSQLRDDRLPDHFPVTDAHFHRALAALSSTGAGDDSMARALSEGRLFLSDCKALDGLTTTQNQGRQKYTAAAMGLFVRPLDRSSALLPVAIQCGQTPSAATPLFTPADGWRWRIAQSFLSLGEGSIHEAAEHLGLTHLLVEAFAIAARRNLASAHPITALLEPHFEHTHFINYTARHSLIADGGTLDQLMPQPIAATRSLVAAAVSTFDVGAGDPRSRLRALGLLDVDALPECPYRDDALPHWDSLHQWVGDYLRLYYRDDEAVAGDPELQAFVAELSAKDGGRLRGVPEVRTIASLASLLTLVVFTASVQHAAVNFPQYPFMGYLPGIPAGLYAPPPTLDTPDAERSLLAALPPSDVAVLQTYTVYQLSAIRLKALGSYAPFDDPRVGDPLGALRARLASLESAINVREASRPLSYPYLLPSLVPASIII